MSFSPSQFEALQAIVRASTCVSILCFLAIGVSVYRNWDKIHRAPSRLILWSTLAASLPLPLLLLGRSQIPSSPFDKPNVLCRLQATMITYGFLSLSMWAGCMAVTVYLAVVRKHSLALIAERQWIAHLLAWGGPLVAVNVPYIATRLSSRKEQFYGDAGLWCWVTESWQEYRMILFYVPIWAVFLLTLMIYGMVIAEVNDTFKPGVQNHVCFTIAETQCQRAAKLRLARRTALHLMAYFFTYFAAFMNRFVIMETGRTFFGLFVLHGLSVGGVGIMWAVAHFGDEVLHRMYVARAIKVAEAELRGFVR